jgi:hypothetical protein
MIEISEISKTVKRTPKRKKVVITDPEFILETATETGMRS